MIDIIIVIGALLIFFVFATKLRGMKLGAKLDDFLEKKRTAQLKALNAYREENGLKPLEADAGLHKIAKIHSLEMATSGVCGHKGEDERLDEIEKLSGSRFAAENCFKYPRGMYAKRIDGRLAQTWLRSPQNRVNTLSRRFKKVGIGVVSKGGQVYTTHLFFRVNCFRAGGKMNAESLQQELGKKDSSGEYIAEAVLKDLGLVPVLTDGLSSPLPAVCFKCAKVLRIISGANPGALYPYFDLFENLLGSKKTLSSGMPSISLPTWRQLTGRTGSNTFSPGITGCLKKAA